MEKRNIDLKFIEKIRKIKKQKRTIKPEQPESGLCGDELIKLNKRISKEHTKLDFQKLFNDILTERLNKTNRSSFKFIIVQGFNPYIVIKDDELGIFRVEDMGENYLVPVQNLNPTVVNKIEEFFKINGLRCEQLNENYLSISKIKRELLID